MDFAGHCCAERGALLDIHPAHRILHHLVYGARRVPCGRAEALPVLSQERFYNHILDRLEAEIDENDEYDGAKQIHARRSVMRRFLHSSI